MSRGTQERTHSSRQFRLQGFHLLCPSFPTKFTYQLQSTLLYALQPLIIFLTLGLGYSRFARTTKGISLISLPVGTKIFQFPTFALLAEWSYGPGFPIRKSLGQSLFCGYPRLIAAKPRPSSPLTAKASTVHS